MKLRRFWFEFDVSIADIPFPGALIGCGVTAFDVEDAKTLLQRRLLGAQPMPEIRRVIVDVDVSKLDPGHVLPNMAPPDRRGIWFPAGFTEPT